MRPCLAFAIQQASHGRPATSRTIKAGWAQVTRPPYSPRRSSGGDARLEELGKELSGKFARVKKDYGNQQAPTPKSTLLLEAGY